MSENNPGEISCEEIIDIINDMVDNEIDDEKLALAKKLVDENPQCCTLYQTLLKTVELYRKQRDEMAAFRTPKLRWDQIMEKAKESE